MESGDNCKDNTDIFKTLPELFPVLWRVWNEGIITMVLTKSNIAVAVSPRKYMEIA